MSNNIEMAINELKKLILSFPKEGESVDNYRIFLKELVKTIDLIQEPQNGPVNFIASNADLYSIECRNIVEKYGSYKFKKLFSVERTDNRGNKVILTKYTYNTYQALYDAMAYLLWEYGSSIELKISYVTIKSKNRAIFKFIDGSSVVVYRKR